MFLRAQHHTRKHAAKTEFCDVDWTCEGSGLGNKNKTGRVNTAWNQLTGNVLSRLLLRSPRNRRHQQHLIAFLERVAGSAEKAYVFLVHINIQEPPNLSLVVAQVRLQLRKFLIQHRK